MVEFAAQRSETKSVCLSFSAGPWRKTKRKARSFKRQSAGPPRLELILFANVAGQDASVWRWHHPPPNPFSSPPPPSSPLPPFFFSPPLVPCPLLCLPARLRSCSQPLEGGTGGIMGMWGGEGGGSSCTYRAATTEPPRCLGTHHQRMCFPITTELMEPVLERPNPYYYSNYYYWCYYYYYYYCCCYNWILSLPPNPTPPPQLAALFSFFIPRLLLKDLCVQFYREHCRQIINKYPWVMFGCFTIKVWWI